MKKTFSADTASVTDRFGRRIDTLRISVTDHCNLRCTYCETGLPYLPPADMLTFEEIRRAAGAFARLGVRNVRITGGEPLLRDGIPSLAASLKGLEGIVRVTLTTNGLLLRGSLPALLAAGLDGVNVSLDTLKPEVYHILNGGGGGHGEVLRGIEACARSGLPVKINCVPVPGANDTELEDIAGLARDTVSAVRFIERMPLEAHGGQSGGSCIPSSVILARLTRRYGPALSWNGSIGGGPARYVTFEGFQGCIGFISAVSEGFCQSCNRVRLTSDGRLKLCLAREGGLDLRAALREGLTEEELDRRIAACLKNKPRGHDFGHNQGITAMRRTGG